VPEQSIIGPMPNNHQRIKKDEYNKPFDRIDDDTASGR
jgi:hypothetical protein